MVEEVQRPVSQGRATGLEMGSTAGHVRPPDVTDGRPNQVEEGFFTHAQKMHSLSTYYMLHTRSQRLLGQAKLSWS